MKQRFVMAVAVALPLAAGSLAACSSTASGLIGPSNQLQVTDTTDNFQFQVTALANITQTFNYNWRNTGDSATVNQASSLTGGSAFLKIKDSTGTQLYSATLTGNGTFKTLVGHAGTWQIEVVLTGASGAVNFRVQKA